MKPTERDRDSSEELQDQEHMIHRHQDDKHSCMRFLYLLLLVSVTCVGCNGTTEPDPTSAIAIGTATMDGRPITGGRIMFMQFDDSRQKASARLSEQGTFRVNHAPIGKCRVVVDNLSIKDRAPELYVPLPDKYKDFERTDLVVDLAAGENDNISIECKP